MRNTAWIAGVVAGGVVAGVAGIFLWTWLVIVLALAAGVKVGNVIESYETRKQIGV
jgi:hypothetical protein